MPPCGGMTPAPGPCKVRAHLGTRLVAGPGPNQMACPIRTLSVKRQADVPVAVQGGSGGIPRPFEGGIGGPGGHRGEVGIPPAPLAGGAIPQRKNDLANAKTFYRLESCTWKRRKPLLQHANAPCHRISAAGGTLYRLVLFPGNYSAASSRAYCTACFSAPEVTVAPATASTASRSSWPAISALM